MPSGWSSTTPPSIRHNGRRFGQSARNSDPHGIVRRWVRQAERNAGTRAGLTTSEREELKRLQREVVELKRANEILKKAAAFFAQAELDRRVK